MASVDIQNASAYSNIPSNRELRLWVDTALTTANSDVEKELCIRVVNTKEIRTLNRQYRSKDNVTNILSFPCDLPVGVDLPMLGDLVICAEVVAQEAMLQNKVLNSHWAHMVVHGTLHLVGYDHANDAEAEEMERLEIHILASLGHASPYEYQ